MKVTIHPPEEMIEASISLPLSKSMSNRALIMNALTPGAPALAHVAECDDTAAIVGALAEVGAKEVNVGPAGTAMRFLTAYYAAKDGSQVVLDGNERMRQRPIGPLVDALRQCGADIEYAGEEGFPPLRIKGARLHGGNIEVLANISSQFISAIMMVAPTFDSPLEIKLKGEISSLPYLKMTLEMMKQRGIEAELERDTITIQSGDYALADADIERDWSAASYWYEISAMSAGWVTLTDLSLPSLQGDSQIASIFEQLGVLTEAAEEEDGLALTPSPEVFSRLDLNLSDTPDVAQTLAVTCCMLGVPFHFKGLESLKIKETDRLAALCEELAKLSFVVEAGPGSLQWEGARVPVGAVPTINAHGDHRMAMAFAPVGYFVDGLMIDGAETVSKSYPTFWDDMRRSGFDVVIDEE